MNLRPLHDRVIVHRLEEGEQQIGGIIIPDTAKEKPQQGTVIAAGNGKATTRASGCRSTSKQATGSSSASIPARRSNSTARSTSS